MGEDKDCQEESKLSFEEFKNSVVNSSHTTVHKITGSLGIYDGYKYYRKNKPKDKKYVLTESLYFAITRKINDLLALELINGNEIVFPHRMGKLELRREERGPYLDKDGNLKNNYPIDWDATLKLWYEDKESYSNKTLIRFEQKEVFHIFYNRNMANYLNKSFYEFQVNKDLKLRLKAKIKEGRISAFNLIR